MFAKNKNKLFDNAKKDKKADLSKSLLDEEQGGGGSLFRSGKNKKPKSEEDYGVGMLELDSSQRTVAPSDNGAAGETSFPEDSQVCWDFILVFDNPDLPENAGKKRGDDYKTMQEILFDVQSKTGLKLYLFYSSDKKYIFCKVGATIDRIKKGADELDFNILLDENYLRTQVDIGDTPVQDEPDITLLKPYEYIYGPYEREPEFHDLFYVPPGQNHPFRTVDRIKIIMEILQSDADWGAGLELYSLKSSGSLVTYYPLREHKCMRALDRDWMPWSIMPWEQPIDDIRDYFGEKIGLYFEFIGHYATWLLPLSVFGLITGIDVVVESIMFNSLGEALGTAVLVPFYCIFVAFWAQMMLEFWKRKESTKAMEWGMSNFEDEEEDRPEYTGDTMHSYINGEVIKYFPPAVRTKLMAVSAAVITCMIMLVIACVAVIFYAKWYVNNKVNNTSTAASESEGLALVNALQIQLLNYLYQELAIHLTNKENHRTATEHEDSLIGKLFLFQFVNSYASFFYISFIKQFVGDKCIGSCMQELAIALATIFLTRLIVGNATKFITFYGGKWYREMNEKKEEIAAKLRGDTDYFKAKSRVEKEFYLEEYDPMLGTLQDYSELSVEFGYVTLFVAAFPVAPMFAYLNNIVEIRSDGFVLLHHTRRPVPSGVQDIGTWMTIFQTTALISVVTNAGLICFTMQLVNFSDQGVVWVFIGFQYFVILLMGLFAYLVDDVPEEVTIQLARQEHLKELAYGLKEDENNEFAVEASDLQIFDVDEDDDSSSSRDNLVSMFQ